jgi:PPOX class probable F420-dependent enzyme
MSAKIPDSHRDLLDGPVYVTLATVMPNGQPQVTIVWCNTDGDYVLVNTARGRQKEKNMRARPMATIMALDPNDAHRFLEVRGTVEEITEAGGVEHIDQLAKLYRGYPAYYGYAAPVEMKEQQTRVICRIKPTRVIASG